MIKVDGISKKYKFYHSPADRLREIIFRKKYHKDFQALDTISFEVGNGETLGIIGQNGAGKSTLLKILSGIVIPDSGTIHVDGKVTGLLELGTGFNYEMTGLENIYMNGTLLGMSRDEIDRKKQAIIDFSELGEFIEEPLKTYSSGMVMRLAFSIAIHADPTCFLVDEALSVGDAYFQQKCMRKIQEFRAAGGSIVFVSHDMTAVKSLCDAAILLENGKQIAYDSPKNIIDLYQCKILKKVQKGEELISNFHQKETRNNSLSTGEVTLVSFSVLDENDNVVSYIESESKIKISFTIKSHKILEDPHYGFQLRNYLGISVFETNTYCMKLKNAPLNPGDEVTVTFELDVPLSYGDYAICIGVVNKGFNIGDFEECLLYELDVGTIKIIKRENAIVYVGTFNMNPTVRVSGTKP